MKNTTFEERSAESRLTAIIPTLLQAISHEEKKIAINQMTGLIEKTLLDMYRFENREMDFAYAGDVCAEVMNQLGEVLPKLTKML